MSGKERSATLLKAAFIGIGGNAFLAAFKIFAGFYAGSYAVVGDGIDSTADVASFFLTLFTARLIARPATLKFPYGFSKAENIATKALSFLLFFAGFQFMLSALLRLIDPGVHEVPGNLAMVATGVSIAGKLLLAAYQARLGRRINSDLLIANARNMQGDVLISVGVLLGLILTVVFQAPLLDLIVALLVGAWIIRIAFRIFMESNVELMDGVNDPEVFLKIFQAVDSVEHAHNPHRIRTRQIGGRYIIALDIEVEPSLRVDEAHHIAREVEHAIRSQIDQVFDILVHVEPLGNAEEEVTGITRQGVKEAYPQWANDTSEKDEE
ncbi:MAG TPA: cation diffusion facilitator family transporter [Bacteroidales bacterium]|nr:cation diffusion facilitator family transporter [Bacteroidales bacterium]HRZ75921.1 cation diffusion facilitator family transporter [Bacteroidales bacterium]